MVTTAFRCAFESLRVVKYWMAAWQHFGIMLDQLWLLGSGGQVAAFRLQSVRLLAIAQQKVDGGHHRSNANYRQHQEQGQHRCEALHKSLARPNLRNAVIQFAALFTVVITIGELALHS
jgi:hypothetical protein